MRTQLREYLGWSSCAAIAAQYNLNLISSFPAKPEFFIVSVTYSCVSWKALGHFRQPKKLTDTSVDCVGRRNHKGSLAIAIVQSSAAKVGREIRACYTPV